MQKARAIYDALNRYDEDALRRLGMDGYVFYHVGMQQWRIAGEYESAVIEALSKYHRSLRAKAESQRQRAAVYGSLGMKRTRSGSWE
jgi:hypothetical protein